MADEDSSVDKETQSLLDASEEAHEEDAKGQRGTPADEDQKQDQVPGAGESHGLAPKKH